MTRKMNDKKALWGVGDGVIAGHYIVFVYGAKSFILKSNPCDISIKA